MFEAEKFSNILKIIVNKYDSITDFTNTAKVGRSYISKYINKRIPVPPQPRVLEKIALSSKGETTYEELMKICGYYGKEVNQINEEEQLKYNGDPKYLDLRYPDTNKETKIKMANSQILRLNGLINALQQQLDSLSERETESKIKWRNNIEDIQEEIICYKKMIEKLEKEK